jgi:hypothetical protein
MSSLLVISVAGGVAILQVQNLVSVKLLQNMVYNTTQHPPTATYCLYVMYLLSIKSVKHNAAKSVNRSILKISRHIGFGVFIVHSSVIGEE